MRQRSNLPTDLLQGLLFGAKLNEVAGDDPNKSGDLFAIYVHYDPFGLIHRYVIDQVAALSRAGFRVIFVSNAPSVKVDSVLPYCTLVTHRRNLGHDFGAYAEGLRWLRAQNHRPRALLLMNDSCYGFFGDIASIENNVCNGEVDLWGLTESYELHYHLQSYFLLVSAKLFNSSIFWEFWDKQPLHRTRGHIIRHREIGLSQVALRNGFNLRALVDYREAAQAWLTEYLPRFGETRTETDFTANVQNALITGRPLNPTHYFWELLLNRYRIPLIKRDLIAKNPVSVPGVHRIAATVAEQGEDFSAALEHLRFRTSHDGILPLF